MFFRSLNLLPLVLAFAMALPAAAAGSLQQADDPAQAVEQEKSTDAQSADTQSADEIDSAVASGLDPEGLATAPTSLAPARIQTEQTADDAQTEAAAPDAAEARPEPTSAQQMLIPRTASRDEDDPSLVWDVGQAASEAPPATTAEAVDLASVHDGKQSMYSMPQLRITALGPQQANIHRSSQFRFLVTNDGPVAAEAVNLVIGINGQGRVVSTYPHGAVQQQNVIYFSVGNMVSGEHREFGFEFQSLAPGKIKLTPRLTCSATTEFSIDATAPQVDVQFEGPDQIVVGQQVRQRVIVQNQGNEAVRNVSILQACTPSGAFEDIAFENDEFRIESLQPGQRHEFVLVATAVQPGPATMKVVIDGDNIRGTASKQLILTQSQLSARLEGPELIYLNSMGTYAITITNDQPRAVQDVKIRLELPMGMVVKVVDRKAAFDAATSSITWTIPTLGPGQSETVPFKAVISSAGQHLVRAAIGNATGAMTHAQMSTHAVGRADIDLKVITNPEPIEIGATTSIVIQVQNRGTHPATDVQIEMTLPESVEGLESADYALNEKQITFNAFQLAPGQTQNLTVPVTSEISGDHIIRATVKSSASSKSISAENSLFFFSSTMKRTANRQKR